MTATTSSTNAPVSLTANLRRKRGAPAHTIQRRPADLTEIPLSFGQEQLWFIDQVAPGTSTYNITGSLHLTGALDTSALGAALTTVVGRHETLRTRLVSVDGRAAQVIDPATPVLPTMMDLSQLDPRRRAEEIDRVCAEESQRPFTLSAEPLLRTTLLRLSDRQHLLIVVVHHTVFDGWSFGVLTRELVEIYDATVQHRSADLPDLPIQFADYAWWERNHHLKGDRRDELVGYWRDALADAPTLSLPTDRPRPLVQTYAGGTVSVVIEAAVMQGIQRLGRENGATLFVTLMTAFQVLLHRYSGQEDLVVGTVSANRGRDELAPLVGFLVNTLAVRGDLSGDPSFRELLPRIRTAIFGAFAHQDLPFAAVVDAVHVPRDAGRHPLFQVGFTLADAAASTVSSAELDVVAAEIPGTAAKFDLLVTAADTQSGLQISAGYARALFDEDTVSRLLDHFAVLLAGIVSEPERPISQLPILPARDRARELQRWNSNTTPIRHSTLGEEFERQADVQPEAVAVELDGDRLTYAALNDRANRIARRLRELGVIAETFVGVCMQRSIDRIVALLAIHKAGGAYVPLDPEHPTDRIAFMVEDAGMALLVTDRASAGAVSTIPVPAYDLADLEARRDVPGNLDGDAGPGNAAYVIYTSGSTGRPKGVVVEHRQAVNFAFSEIDHWPLGVGDRVLQFASLNFDVSVLDTFGALLAGATLVLGRAETLLSPPRLAALIRRERISFMCLPPAVLSLISDEDFPDLRVVISGGEALTAGLARSWRKPGLRFVNGYGPTETTVGATMFECDGELSDPMPIGVPLANYRAFVLDSHRQPVPLGVAGELYIGGAGVARGYLNRPELTAAKFVDDPFSDEEGARLYRTGDIVRRRSDGNLLFLGRADDQVKIRGLRVELGEIEARLNEHPSVAQVAVVVRANRAGQPDLVGYARLWPEHAATTARDLRAHLANHLPGYMVPAQIELMPELPLTSNGKIDRRALPEPSFAETARETVTPRTVVEKVVAAIISDLLRVDTVGVDDSFFDLGGNSLQAMQLVARLRRELAVDADVSAVFLAPTVAELASALCEQHGLTDESLDLVGAEDSPPAAPEPAVVSRNADQAPGLVRMSHPPGLPRLYLLHAIGGGVYPYAALARALADTFTVYGIEADGLRPGTVPAHSLEEMVNRYAALIRSAQPRGPYRLAGWSMGGLLALQLARRFEDDSEAVTFVGLLDSPVPGADDHAYTPAALAGYFVADAVRVLGANAPVPPEPSATPVREQLSWLGAQLGAAGGGDEITRRFDVYCANLRLMDRHGPAPVRADVLIVGAENSVDNVADWARLLPGRIRATRVPGNHYSFLEGSGTPAIAAAIKRRAADAEAPHAIDPVLARWASRLPEISLKDVPAARRRLAEAASRVPVYRPARPVQVRDFRVPATPDTAADVGVRVYRPQELSGAVPALLYVHGGGFATGELDQNDSAARYLALEAGLMVIAVDYRLAPEHPYPAGLEDIYAALCWLAEQADGLAIDPNRIGVCGDSAGGALAAATALLARDRGGPPLCLQYLETPMTDDRMVTPSMLAYTDTPQLTREEARLSWQHYLGDIAPGGPDVPAYAAPARASDLSGLPPACVITCEFDPLRDEGLAYGQRLVQAGVPTDLRLYRGTFHGSAAIVGADVSRQMMADKIALLRRFLMIENHHQ